MENLHIFGTFTLKKCLCLCARLYHPKTIKYNAYKHTRRNIKEYSDLISRFKLIGISFSSLETPERQTPYKRLENLVSVVLISTSIVHMVDFLDTHKEQRVEI